MINVDRMVGTFLELVQIDSPSGEEEVISRHLVSSLASLGLAVQRDAMNNVIARLPGVGKPILVNAHMDTVTPGRGVKPLIRDGVVYSDGTTVLGADDKGGLAVAIEVLRVILENKLDHHPVEIAFTVAEETGLNGAKSLDLQQFAACIGVGLDAGGGPGTIIVSAPSHDRIYATIIGKAAHAGAHPEEGINAIRVAAEAIAAMPLGRIDTETTANVGVIHGGQATNIVPERVEIQAEARSRDEDKLKAQTQSMMSALKEAARRHNAKVDLQVEREYCAYTLAEQDEIIQRLSAACRQVGVEPLLLPSGGGSDANIFNAAGIQVANIGLGMTQEHTTAECIAIADMVACARILLACLTAP
ncbi:MAG: M20/M25/M40 family metallo-hydrolase [Chloroflexi bacterium]|nr:M20/M25/M40 family metallo-hydrolase [Chloroflexota bacterium]